MYAANYETSNDIAYELVSQSGGTAKIKMIVSSDWLQNNERKFPVTVDPLIQTSQELNNEHNLQSAFISSKMQELVTAEAVKTMKVAYM